MTLMWSYKLLYVCISFLFHCLFSISPHWQTQPQKIGKKRTKSNPEKAERLLSVSSSALSVLVCAFRLGQLLAFGSRSNYSIFSTLMWLTLLRKKPSCRIMKMASVSGVAGSVNDWLAKRMRNWLLYWIVKSLSHSPTVCWLAEWELISKHTGVTLVESWFSYFLHIEQQLTMNASNNKYCLCSHILIYLIYLCHEALLPKNYSKTSMSHMVVLPWL